MKPLALTLAALAVLAAGANANAASLSSKAALTRTTIAQGSPLLVQSPGVNPAAFSSKAIGRTAAAKPAVAELASGKTNRHHACSRHDLMKEAVCRQHCGQNS